MTVSVLQKKNARKMRTDMEKNRHKEINNTKVRQNFLLVDVFVFWCSTIYVDLYWKWAL